MPTLKLVKYRGSRLPVIELIIGGKACKFIIDTGADLTALCPSFCSSLREGRGYVTIGVHSSGSLPSRHVTFNLFGLQIEEVLEVTSLPRDMTGVIGQDVLSQFQSYEINNQKGIIKFIPYAKEQTNHVR